MKPSFLASLLLVGLLAVSAPDAWAKKKKKHKSKPEISDTSIPQPGAKPDFSEAAAVLAPYVANADQLLSLHRSGSAPLLEFLDKAPGQLTIARREFAALQKAGDAEDQAEFDAAIATCDVITKALSERQDTLGNNNAAQAVKSSGKLDNGPRKDKIKSAAQTDDFFLAGRINRWNKRSGELQKIIADAYARIP